jgi:GNAT superfamily N-acetyltransferase
VTFARTRTYAKQLPARRLLASEQDRIVGHLGLEHRVIGTETGPLEILGIIDLCVAEAHRGRGTATQMLRWVEALARETSVPFLMLFAQDRRLYNRNDFIHGTNPLRWVKIHEHEIIGIGEEALAELMVKAVGEKAWPEGHVDLLGYQF